MNGQQRAVDDAKTYQAELAAMVERFTRTDGPHDTAIPGLRLIRATQVSEPMHGMYTPSLCIIVQGAKKATLADESYLYDVDGYLVTSVHLPIASQIVQASPEEPYLCIQLNFSMDEIIDLIKEPGRSESTEQHPLESEALNTDDTEPVNGETDFARGIWVNRTNPRLLDALLRLVRLLDAPGDIPVLAPLVIRETLYRVLQEEQGNLLKSFAVIGGQAQRIVKAIQRINADIAKPLRVEELAQAVHMSPSSLHKHFKRVTAMSPLQYQKAIRLQEARRLLFSASMNAADAAFQVGYESPSQFSREYARMFGLPPASDVRQHLLAP